MQGRLTLKAHKGASLHSEHGRETHARETRTQSMHWRLTKAEHARKTHSWRMQVGLTLRASFFGIPAQSKSKLLCTLPSMLFCKRPSWLCILLSMLLRTRLSKLFTRRPAAKLLLLPALRNSLSCTGTEGERVRLLHVVLGDTHVNSYFCRLPKVCIYIYLYICICLYLHIYISFWAQRNTHRSMHTQRKSGQAT